MPNHTFKLDEFQEQIVALYEGYHLVLAPPGCGKTKILAERVVHAFNRGVPGNQMLCLTFTNRAAREMRTRINSTLAEDSGEELFVGNVHRFCSQFLFRQNVVPRSSGMLDEADTVTIIQGLMRTQETGQYESDRRELFAMVLGIQHLALQIRHNMPEEVWMYADLLRNAEIKRLFNALDLPLSPHNFAALYGECEHNDLSRRLSTKSQNIYDLFLLARLYELKKEEHDLLDFDDLLILTYIYASAHPTAIKKYSWVQIDEVQDLSPIQFAIVDLFTERTAPSVTIYLGDEQQAIFSFIGARTSTMNWLKDRCLQNIHRLQRNYRSPSYLLKLFNAYAKYQLNVDPYFLPHADHDVKEPDHALLLACCENSEEEPLLVAHLIRNLTSHQPGEKIAVLVPWNQHADDISELLEQQGIRHFKISGTDIFTQPPMELLCAHLVVVNEDTQYSAWGKILFYTHLFSKPSTALDFTLRCKRAGIVPSDFFLYQRSSFLLEMEKTYREGYVLLSLDCTGTDESQDDIVHVSAVKTAHGKICDQLHLVLHTEKEILASVNGEEHPLTGIYEQAEKMPRKEGLETLLNFIGQLPVIGHNAAFYRKILAANLKRDTRISPLLLTDIPFFDTLKATRILFPKQESYQLQALLEAFQLQEPCAQTADDGFATLRLLNHCMRCFARLRKMHLYFLEENRRLIQKFQELYGTIYLQSVGRLSHHGYNSNPILVNEMIRLYNVFVKRQWVTHLPKMRYIFRFLHDDVVCAEQYPSLADQLQAYLLDLATYREADLCESSAVKEKIFISTVHKAKGLEFHNVILYGANEGFYPFFYHATEEEIAESARLFYVGMSRAQKRLYLTCAEYQQIKTRSGYSFTKSVEPTRFLYFIQNFFKEKYYDRSAMRR